jgi:hypothetical protein
MQDPSKSSKPKSSSSTLTCSTKFLRVELWKFKRFSILGVEIVFFGRDFLAVALVEDIVVLFETETTYGSDLPLESSSLKVAYLVEVDCNDSHGIVTLSIVGVSIYDAVQRFENTVDLLRQNANPRFDSSSSSPRSTMLVGLDQIVQ